MKIPNSLFLEITTNVIQNVDYAYYGEGMIY